MNKTFKITFKSLNLPILLLFRIKRIENLDSLTKLDVLDLHGNRASIYQSFLTQCLTCINIHILLVQISKIENLNHLKELRVLNLAGNDIQHVANISGMMALAELNLRRNKICIVVSIRRYI